MPTTAWRRRYGKPFAAFLLAFLFLCAGTAMAILLPLAPGDDVYSKNAGTIDYSNANDGYVMIKRQSSKSQVIIVSRGKNNFQYGLNTEGQYEAYPFQDGNGEYEFSLYEQKSGNKYSAVLTKSIKTDMDDINRAFLYPNHFINYDDTHAAVAMSNKLCENLNTDKEKITAVYDYVRKNILYDHMRALQIKGKNITTYTPDLEEVMNRKMGICFDYSSLMACMLRVQNIPTRLVIGYADNIYHAWNSVLIDGKWVLYDATFAASNTKISKYTTERWY